MNRRHRAAVPLGLTLGLEAAKREVQGAPGEQRQEDGGKVEGSDGQHLAQV